MKPNDLLRKWMIKKDIKIWKNYKYVDSIDAYMAAIIANKTNFKEKDIHVWIAKRDKNHNFSEFMFDYHGKYYELKNNKLKEISEKDIFTKENKIT